MLLHVVTGCAVLLPVVNMLCSVATCCYRLCSVVACCYMLCSFVTCCYRLQVLLHVVNSVVTWCVTMQHLLLQVVACC